MRFVEERIPQATGLSVTWYGGEPTKAVRGDADAGLGEWLHMPKVGGHTARGTPGTLYRLEDPSPGSAAGSRLALV